MIELVDMIKKGFIISLLITASFGGILFSCTSNKGFESTQEQLKFRGNPTTGYTWEYAVEDESVIAVTEDIKYLGGNGIAGAPSVFTYTMNSKMAGETVIRFVYHRPWDENSVLEKRKYAVKVDKFGKINIEEKAER